MPYTNSRVHFVRPIYVLILTLFLVSSKSQLYAGDQEEKKVAWFLVDSLNKPTVSFEQLSNQWKLLGKDSKYYLVATQALAMRKIVDKKFAEAWKILGLCNEDIGNAPAVLQRGHDALKIWLLLETQKPEHAKPAIQAYAKKVTAAESVSGESAYAIEWLAKFVTVMNQSPESKKTYENELRGIAILMQKAPNGLQKIYRMTIETCGNEAEMLEEQWQKVRGLSDVEREAFVTEFRESLTRLQSETDVKGVEAKTSAGVYKEAYLKFRQLAEQHRKKEHELKHDITKGKPKKPSPPSAPIRRTRTKTTDQERLEQQEEDRRYRMAMRKYDDEYKAYSTALAAWERKEDQRRIKVSAELAVIAGQRNVASADCQAKKEIDDENQQAFRRIQAAVRLEQLKFGRLSETLQFAKDPNSGTTPIVAPSRLRSLDVQPYVAKLNYVISQLH